MDETKNNQNPGLVETPGQPPDKDKVAVENNIEQLTDEKIAGLTKEQMVDYLVNAKKAMASATQKYQEAAEQRRFAEQTLEYQKQLLSQFEEQPEETIEPEPKETPQPPSFETDPVGYVKYLEGKIKEQDSKFQKLDEQLRLDKTTRNFDMLMEKEILPKTPNVTKRDIVNWFDDHPQIKPDAKTIEQAAQEKMRERQAERERIIKEHELEKERLAKTAVEQPGAQVASLPPGKRFIDLDESEQKEIVLKQFRHLSKG